MMGEVLAVYSWYASCLKIYRSTDAFGEVVDAAEEMRDLLT